MALLQTGSHSVFNVARMMRMMMMKIVIDNGRRRRGKRPSRTPNQLSDFHANGHEMESARLPLDRSQAQAMSTYLRQTYLNQKTNDTLMRADIETLSLWLLWRCLLPLLPRVACCPVRLLPVARSCLSWPESGTHCRTMRKGKRKSAGQVVKLIEMFRGMRHAAKGFSILQYFNF